MTGRVIGLAVLVMAAAGEPAFAHAFLQHAEPPVGGSVAAAPKEVAIDFTEPVEPAFSSIAVLDASGKDMDAGKVHTAPGNPRRLLIGLKPLKPGTYKVEWRAISVDTHRTQGNYQFTVAP